MAHFKNNTNHFYVSYFGLITCTSSEEIVTILITVGKIQTNIGTDHC